MTLRIWAMAALVALLTCATAQAAPVTVNLRVEGSSSTIFEGPVTTDGKVIDKGDGPHPCDGTSASPPLPSGPTMTSALDDASIAAGIPWEAQWFDFGGSADFFVTRIGPDAAAGANFWGTVLGYQPTSVGGCQQQVVNGDLVLFALGIGGEPLLQLTGPQRVVAGENTTVTVTDGRNSQPVAGATVAGLPGASGPDGRLSVTFDSPGVKRLKAAQPGAIRSNTLEVCVEQPGSAACSGFAPTLSVPRADVSDSAAPVARISGPRNGRKYRRGPRLLKGLVGDDPSGVREVKIALRRHVRGRSCQWWSGRRERFVGTHCKKVFFFAIGSNRNWSYLLPRALPPGRYVLDVKAFDGRRNRDEKFVSGKNRAEFEVVSRKSRGTTATVSAGARTGARVQVMVMGKNGAVVEAVTLRARPTVVRASGRACKVSGSTPLAALVAALDRRRIGWHVRDFGSCERRREGSSGQLFVNRIAKERNRGQDGWVYKVNDFARPVGAADVAGRLLRKGDRVLWLYCVLDPATRSCQRSLRVVPDANSGPPGGSLRVRVRAYDNERHSASAAGARVALGPATAVTDGNGAVSLTAPSRGRYRLSATAPGALPSFPVPYEVR